MKLKPSEWAEIFGHEIVDPDGWRGAKKDIAEPLTLEGFIPLFNESTVRCVDYKRIPMLRKFIG